MNEITKLENIERGCWVTIKHEKDENIYHGFINRIISTSDETEGIKVEIYGGYTGQIISIPDIQDIKKDSFLFYKRFFQSKEVYALFKQRSNELAILDWSTFKSQPRETTTEHIINFSINSNPRHTDTDNEYYWKAISNKETISELFKEYNIDAIVIDRKRKLKLEQFVTIEQWFKSLNH